MNEADRRRLEEVMNSLTLENTSTRFEQRYESASALKWVLWNHRGIFDETGILREIQSVRRDITVTKEFEQSLAMSEERYRVLIEQANEGILTMRDNRFLSCNPKAAEMLDRTLGEILGRTPESLSPALQADGRQSAEKIRALLQQALDGAPMLFEWVFLRSDDEPVVVEVSVNLVASRTEKTLLCVWRDVTERKLAEHRMHDTHERLRVQAAHLGLMREEERLRLSRELHDGIGQLLTGLKIDMSILVRMLYAGETHSVAFKDVIVSINDLIVQMFAQTRNLAQRMRPVPIEEGGIAQAIQVLLEDTTNRAELTCEIRITEEAKELDSHQSMSVYRIVQEALTNILRHANASHVSVSFEREDETFILTVCDNGCGIIDEEIRSKSTLGVTGMRERATQLGGELALLSLQQGGTSVSLTFPRKKLEVQSAIIDEAGFSGART